LPVKLAVGNLEPLRPEEKSGTRNTYPPWRRTRLGSTLNKLGIPKSLGPDWLRPQVLQEPADTIARPLSINFKRLWQMGEVPEDCKTANVPLILKRGKKEDLGSHRLVSLWEGDG